MRKSGLGVCAAIIAVCFLSVSVNIGAAKAAEPIKIGFVSIFSGRVAMLGEEGSKGAILAAEQINSKGGVIGRKFEVITRDSGGKIEEAVRIARDFVVRDKVDFLMDGSSSRESFAVKEVSRDLKKAHHDHGQRDHFQHSGPKDMDPLQL